MMAATVVNKIIRPSELAESLAALSGKCPVQDESRIHEMLTALHHHSFPDTRQEDYRFFPLDQFIRKALQKSTIAEYRSFSIHDIRKLFYFPSFFNIYLFNGKYVPDSAPLPEDLHLKKFPESVKNFNLYSSHKNYGNHDIFNILSLLYPSEGLGLEFTKTPSRPVCIWHVFDSDNGGFIHSNLLTVLRENVHVVMYEFFVTPGKSGFPLFMLDFHEKQIHTGARLENYMIQKMPAQYYLLSQSNHYVKKHGKSEQWIYSLRGGMLRNNHSIHLLEDFCSGELKGLSSGTSHDIIDHHTFIRHYRENSESYELYKGMADDQSLLVFNGKIRVEPGAQKTSSYQNSKFILLGSRARIQAKPQLEIYANDVKCSHGCATGQPDKNALFYMQSRGIPHPKAIRLWTRGFLSELVDPIPDQTVKNEVESFLQS